jgi:hypothetical protein
MDLLEVIYRHVTLLQELQSMKSVMHVLDALFTDVIEASLEHGWNLQRPCGTVC